MTEVKNCKQLFFKVGVKDELNKNQDCIFFINSARNADFIIVITLVIQNMYLYKILMLIIIN